MRKFSLVVAAVVALSLAMAPGAQAASADLINGVQQQITNAGGSIPTSPAGQQTFINNLVSAGVLPADQAAAAQQVLIWPKEQATGQLVAAKSWAER